MSPNNPPHIIPLDLRPYQSIKPIQRYNRDESLKAVKMMRHDMGIDEACKNVGISKQTLIKSARSVLKKVGKTWVATKHDKIPRAPMAIYEGGQRKWIDVDDSDTASLIGRYDSYRGVFLDKLDPAILEPFKNIVIKDMYGNTYTLDTDPELIFEAERKKEEPEPHDIYRYGG